jgi:ATP-dependent DNA helicase PIF1
MLDDILPKSVAFKVGAQVMLKVNLNVKKGLVNGSRGVILQMEREFVFVRFINGQRIRVPLHTCVIEDKDGKASRTQIPFILAHSLTIHKVQGATLDFVICDLGPSVFAEGQAYVALSRARNIKGLFISEFFPPCIKVNKQALKYSKELKKKAIEYDSCEHARKEVPEDEDISDITKMIKGEDTCIASESEDPLHEESSSEESS